MLLTLYNRFVPAQRLQQVGNIYSMRMSENNMFQTRFIYYLLEQFSTNCLINCSNQLFQFVLFSDNTGNLLSKDDNNFIVV